MKVWKKACAAAVLAMSAASASAGVVFAGSWDVYGGVGWWTGNAPTYTAQEAAAVLFGGKASDYVISTLGDDAGKIDHQAWYDQYGLGLHVFAEDYRVDSGKLGIYDSWGDTSAYIIDNGGGVPRLNYAFRVEQDSSDVPEPFSLSLIGTGLLGLAAVRRKAG